MAAEILTVSQMYAAERYAAQHGVSSADLMENAGSAVVNGIRKRWEPRKTVVLCGPGNNGGDGFVVGRRLAERGWNVTLALLCDRGALRGDAARNAARWPDPVLQLSPEVMAGRPLIVDAIFGAGLDRPLEGLAKDTVLAVNGASAAVVAIDVPSGLHGDLARPPDGAHGICLQADLTVTFSRKKPAHVLMPGRLRCGEIMVCDIGIPEEAIAAANVCLFENAPALWGRKFPWPNLLGHKYARGHVVVISGPPHSTGAARLAARAALRAGAGLVSVASPPDAVAANAATLTAVMVKPFCGAEGLAELLRDSRLKAVVLGPGCGTGSATRDLARVVLAGDGAVVLDADALTAHEDDPPALYRQLREPTVLTPHEGEFARIFPGFLGRSSSRIEAVRAAAVAANCTVLLKGADTVVAGCDGRAAVNTNAPASLATAGSGDVLAGMIGALLAQGVDSFEAAAAAVWLHGEAAMAFGDGLISEDLPEMLPAALKSLRDRLRHGDANAQRPRQEVRPDFLSDSADPRDAAPE